MLQTFAHGYALLVGIGQCADSRLSLPVTVNDIQALQQILVNPDLCGYPDSHLRSLHDQNATKQSILNGLQWLKAQAEADPEATVIVYYSGHGWLDTSDQSYYLLPHDLNPYAWKDTAIAAEIFNTALRQIPAKRLLVILDCCHAQGMASAKEGLMLPPNVTPTAPTRGFFDRLAQGEGRVVLLSSKGEQKSWIRKDDTMSIYTYHLIEALRGKANKPGETTVTVADIVKHLDRTVPLSVQQEHQAQQQPWVSSEMTNFDLALIQGGKGLPVGGWDAVKDQPTASVTVQAIGDRSVAVRDASGSTIVTGDGNVVGKHNVVQQGKYNLNAGHITGLRVGDESDDDEAEIRSAKGFEPLPGEAQPIAATKFVCPEIDCEISWVRRSVGQTIPQCSLHQVDLVPVRRS
ncbi:caspase family protein [Leptolyngbya sp. AN03gr2]|uniref:caspase family protein n=1 Tax=unclassified Leptolyngbya TaxID=2650499 RepID=UPI003D31A9AF